MRRMSLMISIASVLGLVALVQSGVRADMGDGRVTVSLKGGAFFPVHGAMKDQASDAWWYLGVDVDPGLRYKPANGTVHLGVDFNFRDVQGRGVFTVPLLAKVTWPITPSSESVRMYGGLGPGVYFINSRYSGAVTKPGIQFVAGMDLGERVYVEAAYDWVGAFYDDLGTPMRADAIKVALGIRF